MSGVDRLATSTEEEREAAVTAAAGAVRRGDLVVIPTDTVYGIAADAFSHEAVRRLLQAKGRGREMPPPVLVSAATTLDALAETVPPWARTLVEEFWPGPLTLVCRQQGSLMWDLGETRGTVAVRMPDDEVALAVLERTGPLAVSSANLTGRSAATDADQAEEMLGDAVAVIVDARAAQRGDRGARGRARRPGLGRMREYLLVFLVALSVTYLLTVVAREIALRTGAVAAVRDRDVHAEPIPYLGGLAMLGGLYAAYLVARHLPFLSTSEEFVFPDAGAVLLAGALVCAVGVIDDIFELDALTKLGGQVLAAGLLVTQGVRFYYFPGADGTQFSLDDVQGAVLTLLVVIGTMNAVNFVDGLDGLAAGVVGIGAAAFFLYCYFASAQANLTLATTGALLSAALAGACAGFLPHNFHPARVFMGDSGSMLIGLVLSASALTLTGQFVGMPETTGNSLFVTVLPVLLPISLLMVPIVDLVLAVVRRTRAGRSPMSADKQHLHHRLLEIGHSQRRAVLIMWMWAFTIATGAVLVSLFDDPLVWWSLGTMIVLSVALTFVLPKLHRPRKTGLGDTGLPENASVEGRVEGRVDEPSDEPVPGP